MRRKKRQLRKHGKVIVMPGTFERLMDAGLRAVSEERYDEAAPLIRQALTYEAGNARLLGALTVALYELRDYPEAKEAAIRYLQAGPANYIEAMELYLSVCIQLRDYDEVEDTISALLDEGVIPTDRREKFLYLQGLNRRLMDRYDEPPEAPEDPPGLDEFLSLPEGEQHSRLSSVPDHELPAWGEFLAALAAHEEASPLLITYSLVLLAGIGYSSPVTVRKFGVEEAIIPARLPGPEDMKKVGEVEAILKEQFVQDPSKEQIAAQLLRTYRFTAYPFEWPGLSAEEVADAYYTYIESLFDGTDAGAHPVIDLINKIELFHNGRQL
ncbi:tetratricopeptide repeat protein [Bhargavaea massiliensis]|uniref:tetratricopeptide repeat protein n=1 Tax=Bhargavaea massiliensis TaxID=2697500 RepID=UPI001BCD416B|nr:tetratricopeptide repeat protein [Bhargavaea massiliensis]